MAESPRPTTAREVQAQLHAERRGLPFLAYRDADEHHVLVELDPAGSPMTVGRRPDNDLALPWDSEVSRVHAQLEAVGHEWAVVDDGLSRNGSYVNGERVAGRRRLSDGDRLCLGETMIVFRAPAQDQVVVTTSVTAAPGTALPLSEAQRRVLVGLCRPLGSSAYATPATNRAIAEEVHLSIDAVKAHLRVLFDRFGLAELPQNEKRARLAALALVHGVVHRHDL
jgi:hypothetical protein